MKYLVIFVILTIVCFQISSSTNAKTTIDNDLENEYQDLLNETDNLSSLDNNSEDNFGESNVRRGFRGGVRRAVNSVKRLFRRGHRHHKRPAHHHRHHHRHPHRHHRNNRINRVIKKTLTQISNRLKIVSKSFPPKNLHNIAFEIINNRNTPTGNKRTHILYNAHHIIFQDIRRNNGNSWGNGETTSHILNPFNKSGALQVQIDFRYVLCNQITVDKFNHMRFSYYPQNSEGKEVKALNLVFYGYNMSHFAKRLRDLCNARHNHLNGIINRWITAGTQLRAEKDDVALSKHEQKQIIFFNHKINNLNPLVLKLKAKINELQSKRTKATIELTNVKTRYQSELARLIPHVEKTQSVYVQKRSDLNIHEHLVYKCSQEVPRCESHIISIRAIITKFLQQIKELHTTLNKIQEIKIKVEGQFQEFTFKKTKCETDVIKQIEIIKKHKESIKKCDDTSDDVRKTMQRELEEKEKVLLIIKTQCTVFSTSLSSLRLEISVHEKEIIKVTTQIDTITIEVNKLEVQVKEETIKCNKERTRCEILRRKRDELDKQVTYFKTVICQKSEKVGSLKGKYIAKVSHDILKLQDIIIDFNTQITINTRDLSNSEGIIQRYKTEISSINNGKKFNRVKSSNFKTIEILNAQLDKEVRNSSTATLIVRNAFIESAQKITKISQSWANSLRQLVR